MTTAKHSLTPTTDQTPVIVEISTRKPSGAAWVSEFPTSVSLDDLSDLFSTQALPFIAALSESGASVVVSATLQSGKRLFLMRWAWDIVNANLDPRTVPLHPAIDIQWDHEDTDGLYSHAQSLVGAQEMVNGYGMNNLKVAPVHTLSHIHGNAIDMSISWLGTLSIVNAHGARVTISTEPRTGMNPGVQAVGASYGVVGTKDSPHWSANQRKTYR